MQNAFEKLKKALLKVQVQGLPKDRSFTCSDIEKDILS